MLAVRGEWQARKVSACRISLTGVPGPDPLRTALRNALVVTARLEVAPAVSCGMSAKGSKGDNQCEGPTTITKVDYSESLFASGRRAFYITAKEDFRANRAM